MGDALIQTLWVGTQLGSMERMGLTSFLRHGHTVHLYTYGPVDGVPDGVTVRDGNEILPESMIFAYREGFGKGSPAAFSNFFRYKLLLDRGGWWVDTDVICLRPFQFDDAHVFAAENNEIGGPGVASAIIKAPVGSPVASYCWDVCQSKDVNRLMFCEVGPTLMMEAVTRFGMHDYVQPWVTFCPVHWYEWETLLDGRGIEIPADAYAVHLWNTMWCDKGFDKEASHPPSSLYETLRRQLLNHTA